MKAIERAAIRHNHELKHIKNLNKLGYIYSSLQALRTVETRMNYAATQSCNGEITDAEYEAAEQTAIKHVTRLFGGKLPKGFFINGDPRGYSLKCEGNETITFTDWGGYQILAPAKDNF